jgi:hypothetical protein
VHKFGSVLSLKKGVARGVVFFLVVFVDVVSLILALNGAFCYQK